MDLEQFLKTVITVEEGWLPLCVRDNGNWRQDWFYYPRQTEEFIEAVGREKVAHDVYSSSFLWSKPDRKREFLITEGHRTIQCDLDNADISTIKYTPTVLLTTSRDRYQGFVSVADAVPYLERLSRKYTYNIQDADRSGWPLGRCIRLPGTFNYKYGQPQPVEVIAFSGRIYKPQELDALPDVEERIVEDDQGWLGEGFLNVKVDVGPHELLESIKNKLPAKVITQYNIPTSNRSDSLWALECAAFRAGLSRDEVFHLARGSANNKWKDVFGGDRELAKDVLRAERVSSTVTATDLRTIVATAKKVPGTTSERKSYLFGVVHGLMKAEGSFIRATDDSVWYLQKGHPIQLSKHSDLLEVHLTNSYGLNASEDDFRYVVNGILAQSKSLPGTATRAILSHYDAQSNSVFIHAGDDKVIHVTASGVEPILNGTFNILFQRGIVEPFVPHLDSVVDWGEELFGQSLPWITDVSREEAFALYKIWLMFIIMRAASASRPILALLGPPGSGKSTTFQLVTILLYGGDAGLDVATRKEEDFNTTVSNYPFVPLDNLDSWLPWIMDALAQSAGNTSIRKRTLWTDNDVTTLKRQAVVAVTAHDPKFTRPDVVDRLLILNHIRIPDELRDPEKQMHDRIYNRRGEIWGAIVKDIQRILATPRPKKVEGTLRIQDFVSLGEWFATALGCKEEFVSVVQKVRVSQRQLSIEEDQLLVTALLNYTKLSKSKDVWKPMGALWLELEQYSSDQIAFNRKYKNAVALGRRLLTMQSVLKGTINIEWKIDSEIERKLWKIDRKELPTNSVKPAPKASTHS